MCEPDPELSRDPGPGEEVSTLRTVDGCPRRGPLYGMEPHRAPTNRVLTAGACDPQLRKTRGCVDGQANLVYNQMRQDATKCDQMRQCRRWEAPETPKYVPGQKYLRWAAFDQLDPSRLALPYRYLRPSCPTLEACIFSRLPSPE